MHGRKQKENIVIPGILSENRSKIMSFWGCKKQPQKKLKERKERTMGETQRQKFSPLGFLIIFFAKVIFADSVLFMNKKEALAKVWQISLTFCVFFCARA